jgi:hypothetical protein
MRARRHVALVAAGVAVVATGAAVTFGALALENKRDYDRNPTFSNSDNGNNDAAYADGAIALAIAAGVTSLVLALTGDADGSEPTSSTAGGSRRTARVVAAPVALPHGGGAGVALQF